MYPIAEATSDIVAGEYAGSSDDLVYAVFNTPVNSIGGSAICAFSMKRLMETFDGPFKEQDGMNANWLPVPPSKVSWLVWEPKDNFVNICILVVWFQENLYN